MVEDAGGLLGHVGGDAGRLRPLYLHVFDPVGAVGNLQRGPVGGVFGLATVPVGAEAKDVLIEGVLFCDVVDDVADVNDVRAERVRRNGERVRGRLDELDAVAFGILHFEVPAAVAGFGDCGRDGDVVRGEIPSQLFGVGGVICGVVEAVGGGRAWGKRQDFHELNRVEVVADARGILRVCGFECTEVVDVEGFGFGGVGGVDAEVRDAGNSGPLLAEGRGGEQ